MINDLNNQYITTVSEDNKSAVMLLTGTIGEDIMGNDFAQELAALENYGFEEVTIKVNSGGGSVFEGYTIFNAIIDSNMKIKTHVIGIAASMAGVIVMAADEVIMNDYSLLMLHNPSGGSKEILTKIKTSLVTIFNKRTNIDIENLNKVMDVETWFNAEEALANGYITSINETGKNVNINVSNSINELYMVYNSILTDGSKNENEKMENSELKETIIEQMVEVTTEKILVENNEPDAETITETNETTDNTIEESNEESIEVEAVITNDEETVETEVESIENTDDTDTENNEDASEVDDVINDLNDSETIEVIENVVDIEVVENVTSEIVLTYENTINDLTNQVTELSNIINEYKEKELNRTCEDVVNAAIKAGKISATQFDIWVNMAKTDLENVKNIINGLTVNRKSPSIVNILKNDVVVEQQMSFRELEKSNPAKLEDLRVNNFEEFCRLFKAEYGTDYR
jgi:ATP-dependent protease ClpP protease subunit